MDIQLDQTIADKLNTSMKLGGGVELPFVAPYLWVINGDPKMKSVGGAMYFGGWACKAEDFNAVMEQFALSLPPNFKQQEIVINDGSAFDSYTARSLLVAPIGVREAWLKDDKRYPGYVEGARRHVQALVFMGVKTADDKPYEPWGPIVLSAKGYQARHLLDSFSAWNKHSSSLRLKIAKNVPAWCFYLAIGTFAKERVAQMVGQAGTQSSITPIGPYLPQDMTPELLTKLFVGQEVAVRMADYLDQAQEWLNAWKGDTGNDVLNQVNTNQDENGAGPDLWPANDAPF